MGGERKGWGGGRCEAREGASGEQSDCMEEYVYRLDNQGAVVSG